MVFPFLAFVPRRILGIDRSSGRWEFCWCEVGEKLARLAHWFFSTKRSCHGDWGGDSQTKFEIQVKYKVKQCGIGLEWYGPKYRWCGYSGSDPLSFVFVVVVVVDDIGLLVFCVLVGHFVLGLSLGGPIQWQSVQYPKMKPIKYYQGSTIAHGCLLPNLQASAFCIWDADRCSRYLAIVLGRTILGVPLKSSNPSRKLIETPWVKFWQPWWFPMIHDATNSERLQRDQGMIWMHPTQCATWS